MLFCDVSGPNGSGLDDARIDAAKVQLASKRRVDELHCIQPEAVDELPAARVWLTRHFEQRCPNGQSRSRRQVRRAQVQVEVQLIAGERPTLPVLGHERNEACVDDVDLHVGVRRLSGVRELGRRFQLSPTSPSMRSS